MTRKYVYLGRFSPFHLGHEMTLKKMIDLYGVESCLVMVGSSNSLNDRTPYTYEARKTMIQTIFPDVEIIPLPDIQPERIVFDGSTNDVWLKNIGKIAEDRDEKFVFVGGSKEDVAIQAQVFETEILVPRESTGRNFSATKVREALKMINPKIVNQVINFDFK